MVRFSVLLQYFGFRCRLLALVCALALAGPARADVQTLLQLVDYMGVDYPAAVQNGEIVNEFEYAEMEEFAGRIDAEIAQLGQTAATPQLEALSETLKQSVGAMVDPENLAGVTQAIRELLMSHYEIVLTPRAAPDLNRAASLYAENCAACHGETGQGDGPLARGMDPSPTDFRDDARARQRSVYGLYNTITLGVEGTPMPARPDIADRDRWGLAFYVGGLAADKSQLETGAAAWAQNPLSLDDAVIRSPAELAQANRHGAALAFYVRHNPAELFAGQSGPLQTAEQNLSRSLQLYREGKRSEAQQLAVTAYLEGFELIEAPLSNVDAELMRRAEAAMMNYRHAVTRGADVDAVQGLYNEAMSLLNESAAALSGEALSPSVAFSGSLIILLREGLEIILVLAAIITFLVKTERRAALKYVHAGWFVALIAGIATWAVSAYVITISGATREITEGFTALVAAGILLYVGFWMHRNANMQVWNQYLRSKLKSALDTRTMLTLVVVSFLAVYREIFEIILFYQALWAQVEASAQPAVFYGAVAAALLLVAFTFAVYKFGMRLPLKQFFTASAAIMVILAFIFAGKGIAALQEAGSIPTSPIPGPTIDLLGIYPNLQALGLQLLIILLVAGALFYEKRSRARPA